MNAKVFFDTNILVYFASAVGEKTVLSEQLIERGGVVSVQVLNEFTNVALRKQKLSWPEIRLASSFVRARCRVVPLSIETHEMGVALVERYNFSVYDAMIVAAARLAGCRTLYTEDLHNGQVLDGLRIVNPYV